MQNLWAILALCTLLIGSHGAAYKIGGDNREESIKAKNALNENKELIGQARIMVNAFQDTQRQMNDLRKNPDPVAAPASIQSTFSSLCEERKARGIPCQAPRPTSKPNDQR